MNNIKLMAATVFVGYTLMCCNSSILPWNNIKIDNNQFLYYSIDNNQFLYFHGKIIILPKAYFNEISFAFFQFFEHIYLIKHFW